MNSLDTHVNERNFNSYMKHIYGQQQEQSELYLKELVKARMKRFQKDLKERFEKQFGLKNKPIGGMRSGTIYK